MFWILVFPTHMSEPFTPKSVRFQNFPCSLAINIASRAVWRTGLFVRLLRRKMIIILPLKGWENIFFDHTYTFLFKKVGRSRFLVVATKNLFGLDTFHALVEQPTLTRFNAPILSFAHGGIADTNFPPIISPADFEMQISLRIYKPLPL